jgi:hypothetical protein
VPIPAGEEVAGRVVTSVYAPPLNMTSTTDLALPGLHGALRHGDVKALPADLEAAAFIVASIYIREVPDTKLRFTN